MNVPAFTMPENAAEQMVKTAETRDYYKDLSDAEREAEGLPPREPVAEGEPASADAAATTPAAAPADDGADPEGDDETERMFEEVARLTEEIEERTPAAPSAEKQDELIETLLQHEDPAMQAVVAWLKEQGEKIAEFESERKEAIVSAHQKRAAAEVAILQRTYQIGGKPITDEQVVQVGNYMKTNPAGAFLTVEEAALRVFPGAVKVKAAQSPPAKGPGVSAQNNGKVATVVTEGASGGAPSGPWTPRPNETMDSAMEAAKARLFPGLARR